MLQSLNLPTSNANSFNAVQYRRLKTAYEQSLICPNCNGDKPYTCDKVNWTVDGDNITFNFSACQVQLNFKQTSIVSRIIKAAHIPLIFSKCRAKDFSKFYKQDNDILDLAERAITEDLGLFIFGDSGAGKTFLSSVIVIERAYLHKRSLFVNVPDMLDNLRDFNNSSQRFTDSLTQEEKLAQMYNSDCLIIDDLGSEKPTEWSTETLFKIVNSRYNSGKQIIVSSNLSLPELNNRVGTRICRRINDMCVVREI